MVIAPKTKQKKRYANLTGRNTSRRKSVGKVKDQLRMRIQRRRQLLAKMAMGSVKKLLNEVDARKRFQLEYKSLGSPTREEGDLFDLDKYMTKMLGVDTRTANDLLGRLYEHRDDPEFDLGPRRPGGGAKESMNEMESTVSKALLRAGAGKQPTAAVVNHIRNAYGKGKISSSTVLNNAKKTGENHNRQTTKTGSTDKNSDWAVGRFVQSRQIIAQTTPREWAKLSDEDKADLFKFHYAQALYLDEKHMKVQPPHTAADHHSALTFALFTFYFYHHAGCTWKMQQKRMAILGT